MSQLRLSLFGPPDVVLDDKTVIFNTRHALALLIYLVITKRNHQRDSLATLLWPESGQSQARTLLRGSLHDIKQSLKGEWINATRETLGINPEVDFWVDVNEFRRLIHECRSHGHADGEVCLKCIGPLRGAVDLYTDSFLTGFTLVNSVNFDNWQLSESEDLSFLMENAIEGLVIGLKSHGDHTRAIRYARRWLKLDNMNEAAHRELIDLYGRSGHRSAALKQYDECVRILEDELSISPDDTTVEVFENIKKNNGRSRLSPYHRRLYGATNNLPVQATSFIGREREKDEIKNLVSQGRLLTLTGAGGSGKTRLCIEVASDLVDNYEDGVWFVELASITDPDFVAPAIAKVLDVADFGARSMLENLKSYLQKKELLLVLDNFEHLIIAAPIVTDLLGFCDRLKVLSTSREALRLEGEIEYQVLPMRLLGEADAGEIKLDSKKGESDAIRLFVERATAVSSRFTLNEENFDAVTELCERLDGLPLAIELAAAGLSTYQPRQILQRLREHLPVLARGPRNLPERQQTLEGAIGWSYDLLDEGERALFRRLSVFAGGCTVEAAEVVCAGKKGTALVIDVFNDLRKLHEKSLLRRETSQSGSRFMMLETVREYALRKLGESGESDITKQLHLEFFLQLTEESERMVCGPDDVIYMQYIASELDNIRAAIDFAKYNDAEKALRISGALGEYWRMAGLLSEGRERLESALERDEPIQAIVKAKAASWASYLAGMQGNTNRAVELCEYALALSRKAGDKQAILWALTPLGFWLAKSGQLEQSLITCKESVALARKIGDRYYLIRSISNLTHALLLMEEFVPAQTVNLEGLSIARDLGSKSLEALLIAGRALIEFQRKDFRQAEALCKAGLLLAHQVGYIWYFQAFFYSLAVILTSGDGQPWRAARLMGFSEALKERMGLGSLIAGGFFNEETLIRSNDTIRQKLDESAYQSAWEEGQEMALDEAIAYALDDN